MDRLQVALEAAGIPVWRDTARLWPGEDWRERIRQAITRDALAFVACFSQAGLARDRSYQREELVLAVEELRQRRPDVPWLIPVRLDDCQVPDLALGGGRGLGQLQCADLFGEGREQETTRLVCAITRIFRPLSEQELEALAVRAVPGGSGATGVGDGGTAASREAPGWRAGGAGIVMRDQSRGSGAVIQADGVPLVPGVLQVRFSLPPDTAVFTGRSPELSSITAAVTDTARPGGVVAVQAIDGMPGVGKTALAVHAAHLLAERFPDLQLFIDLHAHTPGQDPVRPQDALAGLLAATGVDPRFLPGDLDGRAGMWRDKTAGQRALLVLDNAASSSQVTPLLPGGNDCLVLVTSRRHLGDLPGPAVPVLLGTLPAGQAQEMFVRLAPRAAADQAGVAQVVRLAGCLPLAISLLARVFARHRAWTLADLLAETRDGLLALSAESDSIAAAFEVSYRHLNPARQRLFRLLGLHPGTTIDAHATAALAGISLAQAVSLLDGLHGEGLLTEAGYRRYGMHDLPRRYARDRAAARPATERDHALDRLLDYYQYTATRAQGRLARRTRPGAPPAAPGAQLAAPPLDDAEQALAWVRTNRGSLLACLDHATCTGQHARVIALTAALAEFLSCDGPWTEAITRHVTALQAARHLGDKLSEARVLTDLGEVRQLTGDYTQAARDLEQALALCRSFGSRGGEASALTWLGDVRRLTGDYPQAASDLGQALTLFRDLDDRLGQATALTCLGDVRQRTGDYPAAVRDLEQARVLFRDLGDHFGQATALTWLGDVRRLTGDYPQAARDLGQALTLFRSLGSRGGEANALTRLGDLQQVTGDYPQAARDLEQALTLFGDLGDRLGQAGALTNLGDVRRLTGDYPQAARDLEKALTLYRDLGIRGGEVEVLNGSGTLYRAIGELARAEECHRQALQLARVIASARDEASALAGLGRCAIATGQLTQAGILLGQARVIFQRIGAADTPALAGDLFKNAPNELGLPGEHPWVRHPHGRPRAAP